MRFAASSALALILGVAGFFAGRHFAGTDEASQNLEPSAPAEVSRGEPDSAAQVLELRAELRKLKGRLAESEATRVQREQEFLQYTQMITNLVPAEAPSEIIEALAGKVPESSLPVEDPALQSARRRAQERADEIALALRSLMKIAGLESLNLLEIGSLGDGFVGPLVMRVLDGQGRPVGSLSADRLRLEGSHSGWTLTLIFEAGYERQPGRRLAFEGTLPGEDRGGERRIVLVRTDPGPWFEAMPELFGETPPVPLVDDGQWYLPVVHRRLNELLARDLVGGTYRFSRLGGVLDGVLRDVEIEQFNSRGQLIQRLVADRLEISLSASGAVLTLRDGVVVRADKQHAFLEGRYRVFLPRANAEQWRTAGLPGLVPASESSATASLSPPH